MKYKRKTIWLTEALFKKVRSAAKKGDVKESEIVRQALVGYLVASK